MQRQASGVRLDALDRQGRVTGEDTNSHQTVMKEKSKYLLYGANSGETQFIRWREGDDFPQQIV